MYNIKLYDPSNKLLKIYVFADLYFMLKEYSHLKTFVPIFFKIVME